jgi:hypothetical protein
MIAVRDTWLFIQLAKSKHFGEGNRSKQHSGNTLLQFEYRHFGEQRLFTTHMNTIELIA